MSRPLFSKYQYSSLLRLCLTGQALRRALRLWFVLLVLIFMHQI